MEERYEVVAVKVIIAKNIPIWNMLRKNTTKIKELK